MAPKRRHQTRTNPGTFTPDTASIVKVFNAALADPLHPTGCIHLLNEPLMVFGEDQYIGNVLFDLRQNHHDFYTTCMRFLVTPPPGEHKDSQESESTKELISIMSTCTCDMSNPTIKYLHDRSHRRQGKPNLQTIFSNIAGAVQMALQPAKAEGKVHKVESNLRKASEKGLEAPLWPTCPQDLFPIGAEETMNALAQWLEIHAAPGLLGFLGSYLEICKRAAIPYFIASPTLPGKFVGIAEIIYMVWAFQEQSDRASCATSLTLLKGAALVALLLTSHCTKQELVEFEKRAEVQHRSVLGLCKTILEWLPKLDASIWPRDTYQSYDAGKGVSEDIAYVRECFTGLGQCIHYFMDLPFDVEEYHPTIVWRSRMHREMEKDPKTLAFSVYFEMYTAQRCFAPGCQETYAGAGRKFAYCSGCKRVPYCSKECQVGTPL